MLQHLPENSIQFHQIELLLEIAEPTFAVQLTEAEAYETELPKITSIFFVPIDQLVDKIDLYALQSGEYLQCEHEVVCRNLYLQLNKQLLDFIIFTPRAPMFQPLRPLAAYTDERSYKLQELQPLFRIKCQKRYEQLPSPLYHFARDPIISKSAADASRQQLQSRITQLLQLQSDINVQAEQRENELFQIYKRKVSEIQTKAQFNLNLVERELRLLEEQKVRFDRLHALFDTHKDNFQAEVQKLAQRFDDTQLLNRGVESDGYNKPSLFQPVMDFKLRKMEIVLNAEIQVIDDFDGQEREMYGNVTQQQLLDDFGVYLEKSLMLEKARRSGDLQKKLQEVQGLGLSAVNYGADRLEILDKTIQNIQKSRLQASAAVAGTSMGLSELNLQQSGNQQPKNVARSQVAKSQPPKAISSQARNQQQAQINVPDFEFEPDDFQTPNIPVQRSSNSAQNQQHDYSNDMDQYNDVQQQNQNDMEDDPSINQENSMEEERPILGKTKFNPIKDQQASKTPAYEKSTMAKEFNIAAETLRQTVFPIGCKLCKKAEQVKKKLRAAAPEFSKLAEVFQQAPKFCEQQFCVSVADFFYLLQYHYLKYKNQHEPYPLKFVQRSNFLTNAGLVIGLDTKQHIVCILYVRSPKDETFACIYDFVDGDFHETGPNVVVKQEQLTGPLRLTSQDLKFNDRAWQFSSVHIYGINQ